MVRVFGLATSCTGEGIANFSNDMPSFSSVSSDCRVRLKLAPRFCLMTMSSLLSLRVSGPSSTLSIFPRLTVPTRFARASLRTRSCFGLPLLLAFNLRINALTWTSVRIACRLFCISASSCVRYLATSSVCVATTYVSCTTRSCSCFVYSI